MESESRTSTMSFRFRFRFRFDLENFKMTFCAAICVSLEVQACIRSILHFETSAAELLTFGIHFILLEVHVATRCATRPTSCSLFHPTGSGASFRQCFRFLLPRSGNIAATAILLLLLLHLLRHRLLRPNRTRSTRGSRNL